MRHYLTYQHNVQRYFRDHHEKYDGVIVPLSIVTAFPSGTYGFIRALCSRHPDKEYAIDPRNALFQKQWNREYVRAAHERMVNALGGPFLEHGLSRAVSPDDFADETVLRETVRTCLEFQSSFALQSEDVRKLEKYRKLLQLDALDPLRRPQFLIPPYFQYSDVDDEWFEISMRCIECAPEYANGIPIRPVSHFQSWAGVGDWTATHARITSAGMSAVWYYPNYFKEHEAEAGELRYYREAVEAAVSNGLEPFVLFAGYFGILMGYFGVEGFGNGIGYGEWRDSGYHRGGTASTRVYLLKLHRFLDAAAAQYIVDADPEYFGGGSDILSGYIDADIPLTEMSLTECLDHFMECRSQEISFVASEGIAEAIRELEETCQRLDDIGPLEMDRYGQSLQRWRSTLG